VFNGKINFNTLSDNLVKAVYHKFIQSKLIIYNDMKYPQLLKLYRAAMFNNSPHLCTNFNLTKQTLIKDELTFTSHFSRSESLNFFNKRSLIGSHYSPVDSLRRSFNYNSIIPESLIREQTLTLILAGMEVNNKYRLLNMMAFQYMRGFVNLESLYVQANINNN